MGNRRAHKEILMSTDTGYAPDRWEFDAEVTNVFDNMLERSIPEYQTMRDLSGKLATKLVHSNTSILDIGSSRGDNILQMMRSGKPDQHYFGLEISKPMLDASYKLLDQYIKNGLVDLIEEDLRKGLPLPKLEKNNANISVVTSILTLMFVPMEYRYRVIADIYNILPSGGALVFVEKVLGNTADIDQFMVSEYYDMKRQNGYSDEDIDRKKLSLEGVLVPQTMNNNIAMLQAVGFSTIDCFWRWMNFGGLIAIK